MILVGLDLETGGDKETKPEDNWITELGMVKWDTDFNQPVDFYSSLIKPEAGQVIDPFMSRYTGITQDIIEKHGKPKHEVLYNAVTFCKDASYIVAHNGYKFDRPCLIANMKGVINHEHLVTNFEKKTLIDSLIDVPWPDTMPSKSLGALASAHVLLNSFPHRTITDVLMMLTLMAKYPLNEIIASAESPYITVQALVDFDHKQLAKDFFYDFNGSNKTWTKRMKQIQFEKESPSYQFKYRILPEPKVESK